MLPMVQHQSPTPHCCHLALPGSSGKVGGGWRRPSWWLWRWGREVQCKLKPHNCAQFPGENPPVTNLRRLIWVCINQLEMKQQSGPQANPLLVAYWSDLHLLFQPQAMPFPLLTVLPHPGFLSTLNCIRCAHTPNGPHLWDATGAAVNQTDKILASISTGNTNTSVKMSDCECGAKK